MGLLRAQGATEYLVLLAVVLIVALVSVALLGFFPGMASDAQITQSQMYWKSAQPIAIAEWGAVAMVSDGQTYSYLRIKNNGAYPVRLTGIIGADGVKNTQFYSVAGNCGLPGSGWGLYNISDYYYLGPGEEQYFGIALFGVACYKDIRVTAASGGGRFIGGASSVCANSTTSPGTVSLSSMGFEYIEYLDNNQQITKREMGKPVIIKCLPPA